MRILVIAMALLLFGGIEASAQKYLTKVGHVWFFSSTPLEDIEAHNYQASSVIDMDNGDVVFAMLMKGFEFEKALMQEHFNEKYIESDTYPKSEFKGSIKDFGSVKVKEGSETEVEVEGDLTIHGVTQSISTTGTMKFDDDGKLVISATFPVTVADYDITIPAAVRDNIAKVVDVHVDMKLSKL